jgi:hypothetical protein
MAEFGGGIGPSNPVPSHEVYSYALDALPMMLALLLLAAVHPGRTLVGPDAEFPKKSRADKRADKAEKRRRKEEDKRAKGERKHEGEMRREEVRLAKAMRKAVKKGGVGGGVPAEMQMQ